MGRGINAMANVFCRKCGGTRKKVVGFSGCRCTTPERSWAKYTFRERFNHWIQPTTHLPLVFKGVVTYCIGTKGFSMTPRIISQMSDVRAECRRDRAIDNAIAVALTHRHFERGFHDPLIVVTLWCVAAITVVAWLVAR